MTGEKERVTGGRESEKFGTVAISEPSIQFQNSLAIDNELVPGSFKFLGGN